jgi:rSAM/selenodomain-associated transferase 2
MKNGRISVIIPVYHEARTINHTVSHVMSRGFTPPHQIIVVDGEAYGRTIRRIRDGRVVCVTAKTGRGAQMNAGAKAAGGEVLLFLHADTRLPENARSIIRRTAQTEGIAGGAFDLRIDGGHPLYRVIETAATIRSRITRIPYGDQAIFLKRRVFQRLGGYREIPIMEDVDLMRRVKRAGYRIRICSERVVTSARRWEREGILYCTLRNRCLILLFWLSVSPERLARYYRRMQPTSGYRKQSTR